MKSKVARLLVLVLALKAATGVAAAWPERPIRVIVPTGVGAGGDIMMHLISEELGRRLGQPVVVENREGAAGNIGTTAVAEATPNGYTLLVASAANLLVNQHIYRNFHVDPLKAFVPVIHMANVPAVLITGTDVPANDFRAFSAYARARKGKINFGTTGVGTPGHLTLESLNRSLGLEMTSVTYRGAQQVLTAVISGELHVGFALPGLAVQYVKAGKVRPLAVLGRSRIALLPDTPSFQELGLSNFGAENWWGMVAPAGTPQAILDRLNEAMQRVLGAPEVLKRLEELGIEPVVGTREEFASKLARDAPIWARMIKELGMERTE